MGIKRGTKLSLPQGPRYSYRPSKYRIFFEMLTIGKEERFPEQMNANGRIRIYQAAIRSGYCVSIRKEPSTHLFNWYVTLKECPE